MLTHSVKTRAWCQITRPCSSAVPAVFFCMIQPTTGCFVSKHQINPDTRSRQRRFINDAQRKVADWPDHVWIVLRTNRAASDIFRLSRTEGPTKMVNCLIPIGGTDSQVMSMCLYKKCEATSRSWFSFSWMSTRLKPSIQGNLSKKIFLVHLGSGRNWDTATSTPVPW